MQRLLIATKALLQLGPRPVLLFAWYRFCLVMGLYRRSPPMRARMPVRPGFTMQRMFGMPSEADVRAAIGEDGLARLLELADEIVEGRYREFGGAPVPISLSIVGRLSPWTEYERRPVLLRPLLPSSGDVKFLWESARFGWALTLGAAYHMSQSNRYAEAFWSLFEEFHDKNAFGSGPHWMNGQEVAIRLMAMTWTAEAVWNAPASSAGRLTRLVESVGWHAVRVNQTLEYARSQNNNHLIVEAAALFIAGVALEQRSWRSRGWRWLNWAIRHQFSQYGEYIQHSTNYHRVALQTLLIVTTVLHRRSEGWPAASLQALARATHWLFSLLDPPTGNVPNLGANDGAMILPLSVMPHEDFRPTVQAAARAFLRTQLPSGAWDDLSLWLGFPARSEEHEADVYLAEHLRGRTSWGFLRTSQFRSRLSHMDQLHFDLWWDGINVAGDPGTYSYNAESPWDNPLVATRVHNTVIVDNREQMTRGGRFLTLDWFPSYEKTILTPDAGVLHKVVGHHLGYRGVRHERSVSVSADEAWKIEDRLISRGQHSYRLHWLLPDWEWRLEETSTAFELALNSPRGWLVMQIGASNPETKAKLGLSLVRAGRLIHGLREFSEFEGWASPTYGQKRPALSVACKVDAPGGCRFVTVFRFPR